MTSKNDARDILSLGSNSSSNPNSKSSKSSKKTAKPSSTTRATELGISRELYALLGDNAPSLSLNPNNLNNPLLPKGKNFKPKFKRKPTKAKKWKQVGFMNPARNDGLVLRHWNVAKLPSANDESSKKKNQEVGETEAGPSGETQKDKEVQQNGEEEEEIEQEYRFAQFNTTSGIYSYSNDEYNAHLRDDDWTQAETDYLMDLCTSYDLRFVVIQDRYDWPGGKPRSIEDLKSRYYAICRRLIRSRISAEDLESRQALVNTYLFDPKREIERKKGVARLFEKTPQQLAEEEALYVEAKRMEQNEARFSSERESLLRLLGGWESLPNAMMDGVARAGSGLNIGLGVGGSGSGGVGEEEGRPRRKRHTEDSTSGLTTTNSAQILTTKQKNELKQASFDLEHCIQRFDPTLTIPSKPLYPHLIGIPSSYPPTLSSSMDGPTPNTNVNLNSNASHGAYFRSTRILTTRPHLLIRTNQTLSELIPPVGPKLVFPTARNIEKWEGLLGAVTSGLEMKKALDRVESELRVAQGRYDSLLEQQKEKEKNKEEGQNDDEGEGEGSGLDKGKQREKTQEELRIEKSMEMMIQARDKDLDRDRIDREVEKSLEQSLEKEKEDEINADSNKRPRSESLVDGEGGGEEAKRARREE